MSFVDSSLSRATDRSSANDNAKEDRAQDAHEQVDGVEWVLSILSQGTNLILIVRQHRRHSSGRRASASNMDRKWAYLAAISEG